MRSNHLPNLERRADRFRVMGFYDVVAAKAAELAGTGDYRVYDSYPALLADEAVDLVVVATKPLSTHFPAAKQALEAGKHVLIEKPMAATAAECDDLIATAKRAKRVLTVHQNRRLDLDFLALQDVIRRGKIGDPRLIVNMVPNSAYAGGDFVDWGVHLVDQALLLSRPPLCEVSALFAKPEGAPADGGFAEATLRFDQPPIVRVAMMPRTAEFLHNGTPAYTRFYAAGTEGTFAQRVIEDPRDLMNATQNFDGCRPDYAIPDYLQITRKEFYDYLYESLDGGAPLLVPPEGPRNAVRVIEMMAESARRNCTIKATGMVLSGDGQPPRLGSACCPRSPERSSRTEH